MNNTLANVASYFRREVATGHARYVELLKRSVQKDDLSVDEAGELATLHERHGAGVDLADIAAAMQRRDAAAQLKREAPARHKAWGAALDAVEKFNAETARLEAAHKAAMAAREDEQRALRNATSEAKALDQQARDAFYIDAQMSIDLAALVGEPVDLADAERRYVAEVEAFTRKTGGHISTFTRRLRPPPAPGYVPQVTVARHHAQNGDDWTPQSYEVLVGPAGRGPSGPFVPRDYTPVPAPKREPVTAPQTVEA